MSSYRKLIAWQKSKDLAVETYRAVGRGQVAKDYGLRDQLLRAAVSIPSNLAEGYTRDTARDRVHFLNIARASCAELETQLFIAEEAGLMRTLDATALRATSEEVSRMIYALRARIREDEREA